MENTTHKLEGSVVSYLSNINKYFDKDFLTRHIKQTSNGIFVDQQIINQFIEGFDKHLYDLTKTYPKKDFARTVKKIFLSEEPVVNYLIEGKTTLVGYLINAEQRFNTLISVNLSTLDTKSYLHPRDPIFASIPNLTAELSHTGLEFKLSKKHDFLFNLETLKQFQKIVEKSKILQEKYPSVTSSLRITLTDFIDFIGLLKKPNRKVLVSTKLVTSDYLYLSWNKIIFVLKNNRIVKIYNLRGPSLNLFIEEELTNRMNVDNFTFFRSREALGKFEMINRSFSLPITTLQDFISDNLESNLKYLKNYFTVADAINALGKLLGTADQISENNLPFNPIRQPRMSYYENLGWYFAVDQRKFIIGVTTKFSASRTKPRPKL